MLVRQLPKMSLTHTYKLIQEVSKLLKGGTLMYDVKLCYINLEVLQLRKLCFYCVLNFTKNVLADDTDL